MIVNKFLDKIDVLKLQIGQDADKILEAIDIDEMLKDPESYLCFGSAVYERPRQGNKTRIQRGQEVCNQDNR